MICRLCLKDFQELIHIFDVVGLELNVAMVLGKYFWFQPKSDDPISTAVCNDCWTQVSNFHEFYLQVEEAHRLLTERFSIKSEDRTYQNEGKVTESGTAPTKMTTTSIAGELSKCEPIAEENDEHSKCTKRNEDLLASKVDDANDDVDDSDSEMEMQFSILLSEADNDDNVDDEDNEGDEVVVEISEIESTEHFTKEKNINEIVEDITEEKKFSYDDENSFDEQYLVEKVIEDSQHLDDEEDKLIIKEEPVENYELRRSTRHNKTKAVENICKTQKRRQRIQQQSSADVVSKSHATEQHKHHTPKATKKCKGRPSKSTMEEVLQSSCENKLNSTDQCRARDLKSQANDKKIAGYMRLLCHICSEEQPNFATLRSHVAQEHKQTAYAICCNKKFYKRVLLVEHIDKHLDPECYKCVECNKIFSDKQCLRNHMLIKHQPDEVKTFQCEHCPKKFAKPYLLEQHQIVHAERNHICEVCQRGFPSAPQLACHMKMVHTSSYGTMCHICAKLIRGRTAFERHQLEHTGVKPPKVQCEKCGSWHKDKYSLQKHRRRHNEDGTLHVCHICSKVSPNRSALLSHFRYVHASERIYECSVCKKAFKKPLNLKEHMTMHTGEVLYYCPYCPKTFNSNANMHSHRKKMHPREFEEQRKLRRSNAANEQSDVQNTEETTTATTALLDANDTNESNSASILLRASYFFDKNQE